MPRQARWLKRVTADTTAQAIGPGLAEALLQREVQERQRAEEALQQSEIRFRNAFNFAPIGMALVAPDGKWTQVNSAVCELVGYSEAELLQLTFQRYYPSR